MSTSVPAGIGAVAYTPRPAVAVARIATGDLWRWGVVDG